VSSNSLSKIVEGSAKGGLFLVLGSVASNLVLALGLLVVARLLGPDNYGLYTIFFIVPVLLTMIIDFGMNSGLTRFTAFLSAEGREQEATNIIKNIILFKGAISLISFVVVFASSDFLAASLLNRPGTGFYVRLLSLSIPFQVLFDAASSAFVGLNRMLTVALVTNIQAVTKVLASIALVLMGLGVTGALIGQVTSTAVAGTVLVLLFSLRQYHPMRSSNNAHLDFRASIMKLAIYGFPLYISGFIGTFVLQYQGIVLAQLSSNLEIGNLKAATNLLTLLTMITVPMGTTLFPAFSGLSPIAQDTKEFFRLSVKYTTLLIVPATLLVILFSKEIVYVAYGSSFEFASLFLTFSCLIYLLVGIGSLVVSGFLNGTGNTWLTFRVQVITLAVTLPLTPLLVLFYGVVGAIVAQLISGCVGAFYSLFLIGRRFNIHLRMSDQEKIYLVSVGSAVPVALILNLSSLWWVWNLVIGLIVYFVVWLTLTPLVGAIDRRELESIETILGRIASLKRIIHPIFWLEKKLFDKITKKKITGLQKSTT
jgi:O-antigen/teichoic acid export membrane protein